MIPLLVGAGLVGAALYFRLSRPAVLALAFLLWGVAVLTLALAPDSAPARHLGGDWRVWLIAGVLAGLILFYRLLLGWLHARAIPPDEPAPQDDPTLDRYARHIVLREIGGPGQRKLAEARVLIVGAGGLGAPVALYLAGAGVGRITIADDDAVSVSNLQRQVIFRSSDAGRPKAQAAADALRALNPHVEITAMNRRITAADVALVAGHDLILDGSDSFASRAAVNAACVAAGRPLLSGSIAQWEGQVTLFDPAGDAPCMACLFPEPPAPGLAPDCAAAGVAGPLPGVVGSIMALEAIKQITGAGTGLRRRLLIFDGLYGETRIITICRRPDCPVCGQGKGPPA